MPDYVAWKHRASHFLQGSLSFFAAHTFLLQPITQHMFLFSILTVGIWLCEGWGGNSCNCSVACLHGNLLISVIHQPDKVPETFPCCLHWGEAGVSVCMHAQGDTNLGNERTKNKIQQKFEKTLHNFTEIQVNISIKISWIIISSKPENSSFLYQDFWLAMALCFPNLSGWWYIQILYMLILAVTHGGPESSGKFKKDIHLFNVF